jgi:hypothetical protein
MKENPLLKLRSSGQSIWLDYIRCHMLVPGGHRRLIEPWVVWLMVLCATTGGA